MKKTLSLLCAACIAVGMQAQTYMVNDFESGLNGANAAWGGTAELIDNPCSSSDNSSTKVLKVVSTEFANVAIPLNLPEGKTLADYTGVRLQLAVLEGSENITWVGNELGLVDNDTQEKTFQVAQNSWGDATYNTWMSLDFNFDETILATYLDGNHASTSLLIKVGRQAFNYAIDNIRLIEKEQVADPNTIFTFETMDLGTTPRCGMPWSGSCEVAENPYTTGINTSSKALKVNGGECSPVTFTEALPAGKTWNDYSGIKLQVCFLENGFEWCPIEMGVRTDGGSHIKFGYTVDASTGQEGAGIGDYTPGEWLDVELKIDPAMITDEAKSVRTMYLRLMKSDLSYLYDNLVLIPRSSTGAVSEVVTDDMKVYGANGCINVDLQKDMQVTVYSVDGRIISSQMLSSGRHTIEVPKGIYIVNRTKVAVF
ncbi:DUF6383 domain-containing protein [Barnesiella intestinihominis]|uniref:DUF6383 domain-containing protein n=1 Tax=Barnesiella intestinihominis TaxID=487174 RepID=UPI00266CE342|nr:DUF6383 domain-containing protein [Barnesiella intestinihominis]